MESERRPSVTAAPHTPRRRRPRPGTVRGVVLFAAALVASATALPRIAPAQSGRTVEVRISSGADDAEELANRFLDVASSDLELAVERTPQTVGLRFPGVGVPRGATITAAWIQFTVDEAGTAPAALTLQGQDAANAAPFAGAGNISSRPRTTTAVSWTPAPWTVVGAAGVDQRTPDLSSILQPIVSRSDWASGNALAVIVTGTGTRTAESFEGKAVAAPFLHLEYTTATTSTTTAPTSTTTTTPSSGGVFEARIAAGANDVEQIPNGWLIVGSSDLELVEDPGIQTVGLRYPGVPIPRGATVTAAWLRFTVDETTTGPAALRIHLHDTGDAPPFAGSFGVSNRPATAAVDWVPQPWNRPGTSTDAQRTPSLVAQVQAIVNRSDWSAGNAMAVVITGTGRRTAVAFESAPGASPLLHVEWSGSTTTTTVPVTTTTSTTTTSTTTTTAPTTTTTSTSATTTTVPQTVTRLAVIGDYGSGNTRQGQVAAMIDAAGVQAVVTTGDNVYSSSGFDRLVGRYYHEWIGAYGGVYGAGAPVNRFFPSLGNHDYVDVGLAGYLDFFTLPGAGVASTNTSGNERYYDARLGNVHLFILNSQIEEPDGLVPASVQGIWLQTALAASSAEWKIVVFHNPPYASTPGKSATYMRWPFAAWGADLVLNGDAHVYERLRVDGFDYVISGLGINHSPQTGPLHPGSQAFYSTDDAGALFLTACTGAIHLEYRALAGGLIDSHTIGTGTCP